MKKQAYVDYLYPFALASEKISGISAIAQLAQGALESAWFSVAPGNMIFGIKDTDGVNGNEQLITTTEYSRSANAKFSNIISVTPVMRNRQKWYKYKIQAYFRKYPTPKESFVDHANFFFKNKRYAKALLVKNDPYKFIDEIAKAGYATDPNYANTLKSIAKNIEKLIPKPTE
jgi:flagellum-specific peptidoglycan hydrolase FlgJ